MMVEMNKKLLELEWNISRRVVPVKLKKKKWTVKRVESDFPNRNSTTAATRKWFFRLLTEMVSPIPLRKNQVFGAFVSNWGGGREGAEEEAEEGTGK